jgi:hypothetical protein
MMSEKDVCCNVYFANLVEFVASQINILQIELNCHVMFVSCLVRLKVLGSYAAILFVLDDLAAV